MCEKEKEWKKRTNEFDNKLKQFKANKNSIINSIRLEYKFIQLFFEWVEMKAKNKKEVFCVKIKLLKFFSISIDDDLEKLWLEKESGYDMPL
jgi:hypothetical protein